MKKFRLGTTSYVIPDEIMPNIRFLAGKTEDIELILFEVEEENLSNLPSAEEMDELSHLAREFDLSYTIHLPLDLKLGAGGAETDRSASRALRVMEHVQPIEPLAYVLHVEGMEGQSDDAWVEHTIRGLQQIETRFQLERVCVENLEGFPEAFWDPLFDQVSVSRCIDIGHLWVDRLAAVPYLQQRLQRTRVIHLHGIGTRDHQSLRHMPQVQVEEVLEFLIQQEYDGVVTLEMFSEEDVFGSTEMVRELLEANGWAD